MLCKVFFSAQTLEKAGLEDVAAYVTNSAGMVGLPVDIVRWDNIKVRGRDQLEVTLRHFEEPVPSRLASIVPDRVVVVDTLLPQVEAVASLGVHMCGGATATVILFEKDGIPQVKIDIESQRPGFALNDALTLWFALRRGDNSYLSILWGELTEQARKFLSTLWLLPPAEERAHLSPIWTRLRLAWHILTGR